MNISPRYCLSMTGFIREYIAYGFVGNNYYKVFGTSRHQTLHRLFRAIQAAKV